MELEGAVHQETQVLILALTQAVCDLGQVT